MPVINYIDRSLELAHRCKESPPRSMWISLCRHSQHHDFRILSIRKDFENFEEFARFMETIEDHVLSPLRNMRRREHSTIVVSLVQDSNSGSESDSKENSGVFIDPPRMAGYEPPLHRYTGPYPILKVEGQLFWYLPRNLGTTAEYSIEQKMPPLHLHLRISSYSHQSHNMIRNMGYNLKKAYWIRDDGRDTGTLHRNDEEAERTIRVEPPDRRILVMYWVHSLPEHTQSHKRL